MTIDAPLSPTPRTTVGRGRNRMVEDRAELHRLLEDALIAHLGVTVSRDGVSHPLVLPTAYAVDLDGPDLDGTLYLHGSVAAGWLRAATDTTVCVTVTELDGLVAARSAFHHSMNYRSAVVIGAARLVDDPDERGHALDLIVDHMIPGRSATLRANTRKELAATAVLARPAARGVDEVARRGPGRRRRRTSRPACGAASSRCAGSPASRSPSEDATGPVPADVVRRVASL